MHGQIILNVILLTPKDYPQSPSGQMIGKASRKNSGGSELKTTGR